MTTQRDMLVETFTKLGIPFEQLDSKIDNGTNVRLQVTHETGSIVDGYCGFYCKFKFSENGNLEKVWIAE